MSVGGRVYLVGAGPWDPGLLTVRGRALLRRADAVLYDYLVNPAVLDVVKPDAALVPAGAPPNRMSQDQISAELVRRAKAGETVVRLKGGDPFVFGRGGEEAEALVEAGIPFEVVPGVTAAVASAAYAGIPVTHRAYGSSVTLVTGYPWAERNVQSPDWAALARMDTVVFYMAARRLAFISAQLIAAGKAPDTPVALIRWASRPAQRTRVTRLADAAAVAAAEGYSAPLSVIIGEVVRLRARIGWYEKLPLYGVNVAITRSAGQRGPLADGVRALGGEIIPVPTIAFEAADPEPVRRACQALGTYDWVIFTSANGVDYFLDALYGNGGDPRRFGEARLACIGPATARRLRERGLVADLVPETYVAEALLSALVASTLTDRRILIPRAEVAREVLPDGLRAAGAEVDVVAVYRTVRPEVNEEYRSRVVAGDVELVTFTSSSTVTHFCALFAPEELAMIRQKVVAACIGPITAQTAIEAGLRAQVVAERYTIPGLVDALAAWGTARSKENADD
jgi:uroporphyrinogen III methyltransferase/synthase